LKRWVEGGGAGLRGGDDGWRWRRPASCGWLPRLRGPGCGCWEGPLCCTKPLCLVENLRGSRVRSPAPFMGIVLLRCTCLMPPPPPLVCPTKQGAMCTRHLPALRCLVWRPPPVGERVRPVVCADGVRWQVVRTDDGLEAIVFTAEGDMRHALNNLQVCGVGVGSRLGGWVHEGWEWGVGVGRVGVGGGGGGEGTRTGRCSSCLLVCVCCV
jgi:hypothetical protein